MDNRRKRFKDNFRLRNISDLDVVLLGIGIFVWFALIRLLNPQLENVQSQTVDATSPFVGILFLAIFFGYIILIGLRIGYKRGKKDLILDLKTKGELRRDYK